MRVVYSHATAAALKVNLLCFRRAPLQGGCDDGDGLRLLRPQPEQRRQGRRRLRRAQGQEDLPQSHRSFRHEQGRAEGKLLRLIST